MPQCYLLLNLIFVWLPWLHKPESKALTSAIFFQTIPSYKKEANNDFNKKRSEDMIVFVSLSGWLKFSLIFYFKKEFKQFYLAYDLANLFSSNKLWEGRMGYFRKENEHNSLEKNSFCQFRNSFKIFYFSRMLITYYLLIWKYYSWYCKFIWLWATI